MERVILCYCHCIGVSSEGNDITVPLCTLLHQLWMIIQDGCFPRQSCRLCHCLVVSGSYVYVTRLAQVGRGTWPDLALVRVVRSRFLYQEGSIVCTVYIAPALSKRATRAKSEEGSRGRCITLCVGPSSTCSSAGAPQHVAGSISHYKRKFKKHQTFYPHF